MMLAGRPRAWLSSSSTRRRALGGLVALTASLTLLTSAVGCGKEVAPVAVFDDVPTISDCERAISMPCHTISRLRQAFGIDKLQAEGLRGTAKTIAILTFSEAPTARHDLELFSQEMSLPKPNLEIRDIQLGEPPVDEDGSQAAQASLDLELAHSVAPKAKLILEQVKADIRGPRLADAVAVGVRDLINRTDADVIAIGAGIPYEKMEAMDFGTRTHINNLRSVFQDAKRKEVRILANSGVDGLEKLEYNKGQAKKRANWPASDKNVIAIGTPTLPAEGILMYQSADDRPGWTAVSDIDQAAPIFAAKLMLTAKQICSLKHTA